MEFRVLGPLEVREHDRPLPLRGTRQRAVLAALLLARNTVVPVDRLISAIWSDDPPGTPTAQIQAAVSALRKTLGADRIETRSPGYLIRVDRGELDLAEFDREVAAARRMRDEGDVDGAADALRAALEWWRDDALVDLAELPVRTAAVAVDERRWVAWEERIEADLVLRRHADLVPELLALVDKQPLRDRLWAQLIRALYRCGRRADALETYQRARQVMRDELGLEPAAELVAVHDAVLADDPALDPDVLPVGPRPAWVRPPCPYRALQAYQPGDAPLFHGRGPEIAAVAARARSGPVTVVGPSGCGKSSLVLAGVLPALTGVTTLVVRPADRGRVDLALAAAVARVLSPGDPPELGASAEQVVGGLPAVVDRVLARTGAERLVVVVDQAEELLAQDAAIVDRTVEALFAPDLADRLTVLATLRADFLGAVLERTSLSTTLGGRAVFTLGAMGRDRLRETITAPVASLPGVAFEPGLVDRMLGDVGSDPGALALLGVTLTLLWDQQTDGTLTHEAYDDLGRVPGALAAHAEGEWRRRNLADDEPVVRRLVGRLVQVRPGGHVTRRIAARGELDDPTWRLARRLSATRLLVVAGDDAGGRTVELAHETLTTHWPRLRGWIDDDADLLAWRATLRHDLERWQRADRDPALLLRGAVLADARRWHAEHPDELDADETAFVRLSARTEQGAGTRWRVLRAGLAAAAALVLVLGLVFVQQRSRTATVTADADSRALAGRSAAVAEHDPGYAVLLAVAAYDRAPTAEARAALFARYRSVGRLAELWPAHGVEPGSASTSTDGRVVAAAAGDGTQFLVWVDRDGRRDLLRLPSPDGANVEVAADGSAVWLLAADGIARLDVASGTTRTVVPLDRAGLPQLTLAPDGSRILLRDRPDPASYRVREWSTDDGRQLGAASFPVPDPGHRATLRAGVAPGSALIEYRSNEPADYRAEQLDLATGARTVVAAGTAGTLTSDASGVVTCTVDAAGVVLAGTRTDGTVIGRAPLGPHHAFCPIFVAGPGGRVVVKEPLGDVRVVDLATGEGATVGAFSTTDGPYGEVPAMVTPDGSRLLLTGVDWVGLADLSAPTQVTRTLRNAEVQDDGRGLVGVSEDGRALVVSPLVDGGPAARVARPSTYVDPHPGALAVDGSGLVADRVAEDRVAVHRLPGLEPLATVTLPAGRLDAMYVDAAQRLVTVAGQQVAWWDTRTGAAVHRIDLGPDPDPDPAPERPGPTVAPTPDPDVIAVSRRGRPDVTLRDVRDGRVVDTLAVGSVDDVSFQPSSDYVLVSRPAATEIWDSRSRRPAADPLPVIDGTTRVAGMTRDAGRFVTLDLVSGHWWLTTHQVGAGGPAPALELGPLPPGSASGDAGVVVLDQDDGTADDALRLDPAVWRHDVCAAVPDADLAADDRAAHPDVPEGPVCAG